MNAVRIYLPDAQSTRNLGEDFALHTQDRLLVLASGQLGAGKTTFAQGLGAGLNLEEEVTSPTFTMLNEYQTGRLPFYHLDLYRLQEDFQGGKSGAESVHSLLQEEFEEFLAAPGIVFIEWAELGKELFQDRDCLFVSFNYLQSGEYKESGLPDGRTISIEAHGPSTSHWLDTFCLHLEREGLYKVTPLAL
ncbi:MAG: tRNA (adenosine(37)-N6)-threonylcarbamoyltransferase complex ATPase subunit type 1 TsaE [Candidatus Obscuribacterales bacterium]|nr:tRNA (adenosine(37)-N6)-threonylcarbamoyltransferase complex ATPase subunit type 1 TsaE [Candidatus Obscuribacterales bacterium]